MKLRFAEQQAKRAHPQVLQIIDHYWDAEHVQAAYGYFQHFRTPPGSGKFWIPVQPLREKGPTKDLPDRLGLRDYFGDWSDFLVAHFARVLEMIPRVAEDRPEFLELWLSIAREPDTSHEVYVHTDSNHTAEGWTDNVRLPIWGVIFHLGPKSGLIGGETMFCTEMPLSAAMLNGLHESMTYEQARGLSREWVEVPQKQNRLIVFNGALAHCAAPVRGPAPLKEPRVALLVNLWDHLPIDPARLSRCSTMRPAEFRALSKVPEEQLDVLQEMLATLTPEEFRDVTAFYRRTASPHSAT
jgi:hypothetical protein